jgi:hypothetical protein
VTSLESKLKTTSQALKEADEKRAKEVAAAKVSADKAIKAAEARAVKAKKMLAEDSQRQAKREEDIVQRIDVIITSIGSKFSLAFVFYSLYLSVNMPLLNNFVFCDAAEQLGEIIKLHLDSPKDPLLYTVSVLESNWRNVRNVLQRARHVLPRLLMRHGVDDVSQCLVGNPKRKV